MNPDPSGLQKLTRRQAEIVLLLTCEEYNPDDPDDLVRVRRQIQADVLHAFGRTKGVRIDGGMDRLPIRPLCPQIYVHTRFGMRVKTIIGLLGTQPNTAKNQISEIHRKCGITDTYGDLIALVMRWKLARAGQALLPYEEWSF